MLLDLTITEKHLSLLYTHAILESSHQDVSNTFEELQQDEYHNTGLLLDAMQARGWNTTTARSNAIIGAAKQNSGIGKDRKIAGRANGTYAVTSGTAKLSGRLDNPLL
jgi:hypothetical protein